MSDRKKGGGLDYTPRAFPGARAPDGPAPDLGDKLAKLGLLEGTEATESRMDARADVNAGTSRGAKRRGALDYTPQAFPGARAPDGPAPDLQSRLAQMGLAEQTEAPIVRADARQDISYSPTSTRRNEPAAPRFEPPPAPAVRRETVGVPVPQARSALPPSVSAESSRRIATPNPPISPPMPEPPRRTERLVPPEPAPRRTERVEPLSMPTTPQPQPVYVVPPPTPANTATVADSPQLSAAATPKLPPVPKEAEPRPLPSFSATSALNLSRTSKPVDKESTRALRKAERLRKLQDKEDRVRISLRLVPSVDEKLDDLAHLRGLDRNTAISVAIAQDWVACFGLQAKQSAR